ncbi:MAG: phosphate acyltransferase PlsX [Terriglobales bacterium]
MTTVIAVDAMGSDRAPKPEVEGALLAAREFDVEVLLVGREPQVLAELAQFRHDGLPVRVVHASDFIAMDESVEAVRTKRDSSIRVGLRLVREQRAAGFVSAGNTGATMATAKIVLGALEGVHRPALAAVFPTAAGTPCLMLDVGAYVDCRPHNLEQFAIMGEIYYRTIFGVERPRVGVLSVGEEESKGNELTLQAHKLIKQLPLNFVGNVEGRDLYNGNVDVIVCDGFIGNVALKVSEGLIHTVREMLREAMQQTVTRQFGYLLTRRAFADFKKRLDYAEYGGAPLLGVKGVCIVGHGSSNANAIKNAVRVAAETARGGINSIIQQEIASLNHRVNGAASQLSSGGPVIGD